MSAHSANSEQVCECAHLSDVHADGGLCLAEGCDCPSFILNGKVKVLCPLVGPAPYPVDDRRRLEPEFVEWLMGYPVGWTEGLSRTARLKALGNAVVPQQAVAALGILEEQERSLKVS